MSILFADGFDQYATSAQVWTSTTSGSCVAAAARTGDRGLRLPANVYAHATLTLPGSYASVGVAVAVRMGGTSPQAGTNSAFALLSIWEGVTRHVYVGFTADKRLALYLNNVEKAAGSTVIQDATWYHIELFATIGDAGSAELRVNGATDASYAGDTRNGGAVGIASAVRLSSPYNATGGGNTDFDDCVIWDTAGTVNNSFVGDVGCYTLRPTAAGASAAWVPNAGANYAACDDDTYDGDTSYVESSTAGAIDTYAMADLPATAGAVLAVMTHLWAEKTDAGTRTVRPVLRVAGANYTGTSRNLGNTYAEYGQVHELNPATSAAWTPAAVNASEVGVELVA